MRDLSSKIHGNDSVADFTGINSINPTNSGDQHPVSSIQYPAPGIGGKLSMYATKRQARIFHEFEAFICKTHTLIHMTRRVIPLAGALGGPPPADTDATASP